MKRTAAVLIPMVFGLSLTACGPRGNSDTTVAACRYVAAHMTNSNEAHPLAVVTKMRDLAKGSKIEHPADEMYDVAIRVVQAQKASEVGAAVALGAEVAALYEEMASACSSVGATIPPLGPSLDVGAVGLPPCVEKVGTVFTYDQVIAMTQGCKDSNGQTWAGAHGGKCADGHAFAYMPVGSSDNPTRAVEVSVPGPGKSGTTISVADDTAFNQFASCNAR